MASTTGSSWAARVASLRRGPKKAPVAIPIHTDITINPKTRFIGSQSLDQEVIDYSYTDNPLKLMFWDIFYFFKYAKHLPNIVNPLLPCDSGDMCELALTWENLHALFVHAILIILQLGFLLFVPPIALLLPLWVTTLFVASFLVVNQALCLILNGFPSKLIYESGREFALENQKQFINEKWFFLNGVAVGEHWMQKALDRLALTFGRQITGIHNRTSGIIFDTIECLIQRNFTYATSDIREAHKELKTALLSAQYAKVVFIVHSQGGIEGSMVLDWLLQELPQDIMGKLEVYTFGNAANHFNNPYTSAQALAAVEKRPLLQYEDVEGAFGFAPDELIKPVEHVKEEPNLFSSLLRHHQLPSPPQSPLFNVKPQQYHERSQRNRSSTSPTQLQAVNRPGPSSPSSSSFPNSRVVPRIEHYAYTTDFVAVWGVLHFATSKLANDTIPKFIGRLFARTDPAHRGSHQFVQHYLDGMFPLRRDSSGHLVGCKDTNAFMESEVFLDENDPIKREGLTRCMQGRLEEDEAMEDADGDVEVRNGEGMVELRNRRGQPTCKVKVKDLSRLWLYRNGRIPPPIDPTVEAASSGRVDALMLRG